MAIRARKISGNTDRWRPVFRAMADDSRRRLVAILCQGPQRAGELAKAVGLAANAVSFHLRWLKAADLVTAYREGRSLWYVVNPNTLTAWTKNVQEHFLVKLSRQDETSLENRSENRSGKARKGEKSIEQTEIRTTQRSGQNKIDAKPSVSRSEDVATDTLPDELL